eukprot:2036559-Ditylum_brightwellii.AAC.1
MNQGTGRGGRAQEDVALTTQQLFNTVRSSDFFKSAFSAANLQQFSKNKKAEKVKTWVDENNQDESDDIGEETFPGFFKLVATVSAFNNTVHEYKQELDGALIGEIFRRFLLEYPNILRVADIVVMHEELEQKSKRKKNRNKKNTVYEFWAAVILGFQKHIDLNGHSDVRTRTYFDLLLQHGIPATIQHANALTPVLHYKISPVDSEDPVAVGVFVGMDGILFGKDIMEQDLILLWLYGKVKQLLQLGDQSDNFLSFQRKF